MTECHTPLILLIRLNEEAVTKGASMGIAFIAVRKYRGNKAEIPIKSRCNSIWIA
jgi:hypothetical protein